jgi:hypothetical protein
MVLFSMLIFVKIIIINKKVGVGDGVGDLDGTAPRWF